MDIKNKKVLILGGWGLVGSAIARRIMEEKPKQVILTSLKEHEAKEICEDLRKEFKKDKNFFVPWWGNIFIRNKFKDLPKEDYINDPKKRLELLEDIVGELDKKILGESAIYRLFKEHKPDIVIDCINTATAIAYQNIYKSYNDIIKIFKRKDNGDYDELKASVEKLISISYIPQLIRHIQILYNSMRSFGTSFYLKIGTSGTGGMGLNIPFTHSEEKPSRVLLSKASVAGAHTLLLFLMARTPGGPIIKELKPTASIAWKRIAFGDIKHRNQPIPIYDVKYEDAEKLGNTFLKKTDKKYKKKGNLKTAFIDTGENGIFSKGEFETITTLGQMEFITPEEIAENTIVEIKGGNTGNDVLDALDSAVMEPTYRAGLMQHSAVEELKKLEEKNKTYSVAFEMLGPPRLSKLLYEVHLIRLIYKNFNNYIKSDPKSRSKKISDFLKKNSALRSEMVSIGLPILLEDGKKVLRGPKVIIPSDMEGDVIKTDRKKIDRWAHEGWVDLREANWKLWAERLAHIKKQAELHSDSSYSSRFIFNREYWDNFEDINIGKIVGWLFIHEEDGLRAKR